MWEFKWKLFMLFYIVCLQFHDLFTTTNLTHKCREPTLILPCLLLLFEVF